MMTKHSEPRGIVTTNSGHGNLIQVKTEYGSGQWPFDSVHSLTPGFQAPADIKPGTPVTLTYISWAGGALWFAKA